LVLGCCGSRHALKEGKVPDKWKNVGDCEGEINVYIACNLRANDTFVTPHSPEHVSVYYLVVLLLLVHSTHSTDVTMYLRLSTHSGAIVIRMHGSLHDSTPHT
jgi:hypothetical protein